MILSYSVLYLDVSLPAICICFVVLYCSRTASPWLLSSLLEIKERGCTGKEITARVKW